MTVSVPENLLTEWSTLLIESLADAGVTDVVLSPGSRSTPFVLAACRSANLRCRDVIDERAAAFYALGQARLTGRPSALLCTSGTAAAHYLPAVIEAATSYTPMVLITADRPLELQACAAPQTIDQVKLFGSYARAFFELGTPDAHPAALRAVRRIAAQVVHTAQWPVPGPVHLNARARKPLEPRSAQSPADQRLSQEVARVRSRPIARAAPPQLAPNAAAVAEVASSVREHRRGVIVCGPLGADASEARAAVDAFATASGYPVLCEASSQARFCGERTSSVSLCDAFDVFLRSARFREAARPDVIVQVGGAPTSSGWGQYQAAHPDVPRVVINRHGWNDPQNNVDTIHLIAEPVDGLRAVSAALGQAPPTSHGAWGELFAAANSAAWGAIQDELEAAGEALGEGAVAREVALALPRGSLLVLGNSMPIRLVDTFCEHARTEARVVVQRGANGIDGLVAGTAGSASASSSPLTLLLGDVSLLHDLTSLALVADAAVPCVIVAIQNRGGRIFEHLPIAGTSTVDSSELSHLTTPHELGFEHAARMFGLRYARVERGPNLREALSSAYARPGASLIEAVVPPSGSAQQHKRIWAACEAALAGLMARDA